MSGSQVSGFVLVDKPAGWTSHDVVGRLRRLLGQRRVGHAGTLDPMATGVLILAVGRATRLLSLASDADKTYLATIRLGQSTTTDDAEGDVVATVGAVGLEPEVVTDAARAFVGAIEQRPSSVSAIKVDGRRAYDRVRAGEDVVLPSRQVLVHEFEVLRVREAGQFLDLDVEVRCGSGTYVRALARDLGAALQVNGQPVGGHLTALRRVESAAVAVSECQDITATTAEPKVIPAGDLVTRWCPAVTLADPTPLTHGRTVPVPAGFGEAAEPPNAPEPASATEPVKAPEPTKPMVPVVAVLDSTSAMVALARVNHGMLEPTVVLVEPMVLPARAQSAPVVSAAPITTSTDNEE